MLIIDDIATSQRKTGEGSQARGNIVSSVRGYACVGEGREPRHWNCYVTGHIGQGTAKYIPRSYNAIGYTTLNNEHLSCLHTTGFFLSLTGSCSRNLVALGDGGWADYSVPPFPLGRKVDIFYTNSLHRTWG